MQVKFGDTMIHLVPKDVKLAKRLVRKFLSVSKTKADEYGAKTFYYTLLCVMYVMSHDLIENLSPEVLALILNARAEDEAKKTLPVTPETS